MVNIPHKVEHIYPAFREAYVKTSQRFFKKDYDTADIRQSIVAAVSVRVQEPVFESQTKTKLGS
jgi:topoisomerase-4 subunit B